MRRSPAIDLAGRAYIATARAASFRPEIEITGRATRVLAEQTAAVDPSRLGESAGYLSAEEARRVGATLRIVMEL